MNIFIYICMPSIPNGSVLRPLMFHSDGNPRAGNVPYRPSLYAEKEEPIRSLRFVMKRGRKTRLET